MPVLDAPINAVGGATRQRTELVLQEIDSLPTLPATAVRLIALTTDDASSAREVADMMAGDPALSANLLALAGRADKGLRGDRLTIHQAVTLLGFNTARNLALSVHIHATLPDHGDDARARAFRRELWRHCLATACAAEELAPHVVKGADRGEAFVAGLLHDIGKVALDASFPKSYARVVERVTRRRQCVCSAEEEVFGLDHTVAGKHLAKRWNLPASLVESIWLHHQDPKMLPSTVRHAPLVRLVHVADRLVRRLRIGFSGYDSDNDLESAAKALGLSSAVLQKTSEALPDRLSALSPMFDLDDVDARRIFAGSILSANRELAALNLELADSNRQLAVRSLFFGILNSFHSELSPLSQPRDVCRLAARALAVSGKTLSAIVVLCAPDDAMMHIGVMHGERCDGRSIAADQSIRQALKGLRAGPDGLDVDSPLARLWAEAAKAANAAPSAVVPIHDGRVATGAILLPADETLPDAGPAEWCALTDAIQLAAAHARACHESQLHQEELYAIARRLAQAQREVVRAQTISVIAEMAAGAAHEINNPLSVISGRAQLLRDSATDPELSRALQVIIDKVGEAAAIVTELMNFAKPAAPQPIAQPLVPMIEALCQHWRGRYALNEEQLIVRAHDPACTVYADTGHLSEMLDAIIDNAVHAGDGQAPRVIVNLPSEASDETVRIEMTDDGPGMSPEVAERAIDPFFSHKPAGRRRGLGLSRAYRLAGINGGQLWIDSSPGRGTTVSIELPSHPRSNNPV